MRTGRTILFLCALVGASPLVSGCQSILHYPDQQAQAESKRHALLRRFPRGTDRDEVNRKLMAGSACTEWAETRPEGGWNALPANYSGIVDAVKASEQRTGSTVNRCDVYLARNGLWSRSRLWFYYDKQNNLTDAEWQEVTDSARGNFQSY